MKTYTAQGIHTNKIYATSKDKPTLLKKLQQLYPEAKIKSDNNQTRVYIYPEPIKLTLIKGE